jgi:hypothetical protein
MTEPNKYASPEQLRYARVLSLGVQAGFVILVATFILYLSGILVPLIPVDQLPKYWGLSAAEFAKATGSPTGWAWLAQVAKGDVANLLGIVVLASISMVSTLAVLPTFARRGDRLHVVIAILLVLVLAVSAANILH